MNGTFLLPFSYETRNIVHYWTITSSRARGLRNTPSIVKSVIGRSEWKLRERCAFVREINILGALQPQQLLSVLLQILVLRLLQLLLSRLRSDPYERFECHIRGTLGGLDISCRNFSDVRRALAIISF